MINSKLVKKLEPTYVVDKTGTKASYNSKGKYHSFDDQPAVIYPSGTKSWYRDGELHRDNDLPAMIWIAGDKEWWINGEFVRDDGRFIRSEPL